MKLTEILENRIENRLVSSDNCICALDSSVVCQVLHVCVTLNFPLFPVKNFPACEQKA